VEGCKVIKRHQNIPALPWHISAWHISARHISPHAISITSSLQPKFLNANAPTLSKHSAIYEETKVVIDVWPGRLVCATIAYAG
jgi:hypothetical protein